MAKLVEAYAKDPESANSKFVGKDVILIGKIKIEAPPRGVRGQETTIFFETEGQSKLLVRCYPHDLDDLASLKSGKEYRVLGKIDKYIPGRPIPLKDAFFTEDSSKTASGTGNKQAAAGRTQSMGRQR